MWWTRHSPRQPRRRKRRGKRVRWEKRSYVMCMVRVWVRRSVGQVFRLFMKGYHTWSSTSKLRTIGRALQEVDDQTLAKSVVTVVGHVADKTIRSRLESLLNDYNSLKPADDVPIHRYSGTEADWRMAECSAESVWGTHMRLVDALSFRRAHVRSENQCIKMLQVSGRHWNWEGFCRGARDASALL